MTLKESLALMSLFQLTYASFKKSSEELIKLAKVWQRMFADVPYKIVTAAAEDYIQNENSPFAPAPGQIRARLDETLDATELTKYEAWDLARKGFGLSETVFGRSDRPSRELSDKEKYFYNLPEKIRLAIGSYRNYVELSLTKSDQLEYRRSNFYSRYEELRGREKTLHRTNPEILKFFGKDKDNIARFNRAEIERPQTKELTGHVQTGTEKTLQELRDKAIEERRNRPELYEARKRREAEKAEKDFLADLDKELAQ